MRNKENTEFGHMHLSVFYRKVLSLGESGILYKSKYYPWSKIQNIELWHQEWPGYGWVHDQKLLPRARISLSNGSHIILRGDALVKYKTPLSQGFSSAFDELVAHLQKRRREQLRGKDDENA